ncbi:MAG: iron-containing alcohol dehydrogenase [Candidatus Poribacteria bacterium]|nr:iron-containing alcohol dehydrogenase [Candidatus Poribacteria bacterium]
MNATVSTPVIQYRPFRLIEDTREAVVVTTAKAWDSAAPKLNGLNVASRLIVEEATEHHFKQLSKSAVGEVVYSVGAGLAADAAKWVASSRNLPLVMLPTAITVDAFFTGVSGVRQDGCARRVPTTVANTVIIDFDTLASAPSPIRAAGICDVLSIATGSWDWKFAEKHRMNPVDQPYDSAVAKMAQSILDAALEAAADAGAGDHEGLQRLIECLVMEAQLRNLIGHSRPAEGSEHYFAYAVENEFPRPIPHGDLVGPGIIIAQIQGQDTEPLRDALEACHVPLKHIPSHTITKTLQTLPDYCRRHELPFGIAHALTPSMIPTIF